MNLAYTPEQCYRDLIERAETFLRAVYNPKRDLPHGVREWLEDLENTRTRELVEQSGDSYKERLVYYSDDSPEVPL